MNYSNSNASCRLCTQESNRLRPLFSGNEDILAKLRILAPAVKVTAEDGLSSNVCERCVTQLNSSCEFKMLLEFTYATLREKRQIQDSAFNEVLHIKDEPILDEIESELAAIEVNETREAASGCNSELDPLSLKLEDASSNSLSSCTDALSYSGSFSQHGKEGIHCKQCKRRFITEAGLKAHSSCHKTSPDTGKNVKRSFCCSYCDKTFNTERGLKIHSVKYHVDRQEYECSVCKKTFTSEAGLNKHEQMHTTEERQHECSVCKETFETGIELRLHSRSHVSTDDSLPNAAFTCSECKKQFATAKAITTHRRFCSKSTIVRNSNIKVNQSSFECSYCRKLFKKEKAVRGHEAHCRRWQSSNNETLPMSYKNTNELQYACTLCSQSFSSLSDLISHRGVHFNKHDSQTNVHQKVGMHKAPHSSKEKDTSAVSSVAEGSPAASDNVIPTQKERKFVCAVCKQEFSTCKGLAVHRWRNHHEIEDSNFGLKRAKQNSTATSDETVYHCSVCEIDFDSGRALSLHRWHKHRPELQHRLALDYIPQRHRPAGIYMCRLCDKRFVTNKERIIHNLTYHGFKKKLVKGYSASHNTAKDAQRRNVFTCHVCMQTYTSRTLLLKHKWHMHRAEQQKVNRTEQDMPVVTAAPYTGDEKYVTCPICNQHFKSKTLLSKHRWYEHKYKPNKLANMLNKSVANKFKEVKEPKHTCSICKMSFKYPGSLAKHKWHRHSNRNQDSMNTPDVYKNITSQEYLHHQGYPCRPCNRSFKSNRALSLHNWKTHRKQNQGKLASILSNDSHTEGVQLYRCSLCARKFTSHRNLAAHVLLHRQSMDAVAKSDTVKQCSSYNCPKCSCSFDDLLTLKFHQKSCSSNTDKTVDAAKSQTAYSCNICSMLFDSASALTAHRNSHAERQDGSDSAVVSDGAANTHTCSFCMQTFESEQCLITHSKVHEENQQGNSTNEETGADNLNKPTSNEPTGANNIQCHMCSTVSKNNQEFEVHLITVHSEKVVEKETSFSQENNECQQKVAQGNNVNGSTERNYTSCTVCSKVFTSYNGFLIHYSKRHTRNKKNMELEDLDVPADDSETIEHELRNNSNSGLDLNDLYCNICQKTFSSSRGLLIHNGRVHQTSDPKEETRLENKDRLSDTNEQINNSEELVAYNTENGIRNSSHYEITASHTEAHADEDETCVFSEKVQEQEKSQSSAEIKNPEVQQQNDVDVSKTQVESLASSSFQCTICSKEFATHRNMLIHKKMAHRQQNDLLLDSSSTEIVADDNSVETGEQQCNFCPRTFKHVRSLLFHKALFHKTALQSWNNKGPDIELNDLEVSEDDKEYKEMQLGPKSKMGGISPKAGNKHCSVCFREFRSFHGVLVHYAMTHQKNKMEDSLNEDTEENISSTGTSEMSPAHTPNALKFHQTETDTNEDIDSQCSVCNKALKSAHGLLIHMKRAHPSLSIPRRESLLPCMSCGSTFLNQHALSIHYAKFHYKPEDRNQIYSEIYRCSLCSATFTSLKGLGVHSTRFHGILQSEENTESLQNILYKCKMCFKVFNKKAQLKTHLQEVHQSSAWVEHAFKQKSVDSEHITEDFEYGCVSCSKNFSSLMDLKTHSQECHKPDKNILNMSYSKHYNYDNNVGTETADMTVSKPLRCPICGKAINSSVGLKVHCKRVHQIYWNDLETSQLVAVDFSDESNTADKPFKCHICHELFSTSSDLKLHNETSHAAADTGSVDLSFTDNSAVSLNKDENSLPSMDISLSDSPRAHMNIDRNQVESTAEDQQNHENNSQVG